MFPLCLSLCQSVQLDLFLMQEKRLFISSAFRWGFLQASVVCLNKPPAHAAAGVWRGFQRRAALKKDHISFPAQMEPNAAADISMSSERSHTENTCLYCETSWCGQNAAQEFYRVFIQTRRNFIDPKQRNASVQQLYIRSVRKESFWFRSSLSSSPGRH